MADGNRDPRPPPPAGGRGGPAKRWHVLPALLFFFTAEAPAAPPEALPQDLTELPLEDLLELEVTTAAKKPQSVRLTAAAVYALTGEDIRRIGATTIPDALRYVPGVNVARIDAARWAVSIRGFNSRFANKLLVMMDGRSVYTPLFSGTFWEVQDTLLEDVDRIEVVRGPGGSLWGANAVNGVINIITKSPRETQGLLVTGGGGTEERGFFGARYGGKAGEDFHYRIYTKLFERDEAARGHDDYRFARGGFRAEWTPSSADTVTFQGDYYRGEAGNQIDIVTFSAPFMETRADDHFYSGGNFLARWERRLAENSDFALQVYYDRTEFDVSEIEEARDTLDVDFQHRLKLPFRQELLWGLEYRFTSDRTNGTPTLFLDPESRDLHLASVFVQDEIRLIPDTLRLILGTKIEQHTLVGLEVEPTARVHWTPHPDHAVWAAVSRAVRTTSRAEDDLRATLSRNPLTGTFPRLTGTGKADSEDLLALELGYRTQPARDLSFDLALFYNVYEDLRTFTQGTPFLEATPAPPHIVVPLVFGNDMDGEAYGFEASATWKPFPWWRLDAAYSFLRVQLHASSPARATGAEDEEGRAPRNQVALRSAVDLPFGFEFDTGLRWVDNVPAANVGSYVVLDARLAWRGEVGGHDLEFAVVGQSLLDDRHPEFDTPLVSASRATEVQHGIYAKLTWRFR